MTILGKLKELERQHAWQNFISRENSLSDVISHWATVSQFIFLKVIFKTSWLEDKPGLCSLKLKIPVVFISSQRTNSFYKTFSVENSQCLSKILFTVFATYYQSTKKFLRAFLHKTDEDVLFQHIIFDFSQ